MCGFNDSLLLPPSADGVQCNEKSVKNLHKIAGQLSNTLKGNYIELFYWWYFQSIVCEDGRLDENAL